MLYLQSNKGYMKQIIKESIQGTLILATIVITMAGMVIALYKVAGM